MDFKLNDKTKANINRTLGMDYDTLIGMDVESIDRHIEKRTGRKLSLSSSFGNLVNRGSLYIYFNRFFTEKGIAKGLNSIKK